MNRQAKQLCSWMLLVSLLVSGCQPMQPYYLQDDGDLSHYIDVATDIEYTDVCQEPLEEVTRAYAPRTIDNPQFDEHWDLTLEEVMVATLQNAKILRSVGSIRQFGQVLGSTPERVLSAPDSVVTIYDPAIQETGQSGVEQALANFDAIFSSRATWDNTDRQQNFSSGVTSQARIFQQDQVQLSNEISKLSATGTQWFFRNISTYTGANNQTTAQVFSVPSDWFVSFETEMRQPLLRNRGTQVNRIPLMLARMRTDQSLIDFEAAVMEVMMNVEQAYWELFFSYYNLQAAKFGRDSALASYQKVQALFSEGEPGGEAEKLAQTKEQYFFFRGRFEEATRDLFKIEANLRYLMGLTPTDHRLIRPADRPSTAMIDYDWNQVLAEGRARSPQLRRFGWRIRTQELRLIAARNQLLPQFDVVALYRWLGNGDNFNSNSFRVGGSNDDEQPANGLPDFPVNAVDDLWSGRKQEFRLGAEFNMPLGNRQPLAQVRSSQLELARERARLQDAELELVHQLTDAFNRMATSHQTLSSNANRLSSARQQVQAVEAAYLAGTVQLDLVLDAQRRQADATIAYYRNLVEHNFNLMLMHFRKGSLIEYNGIVLAEGPWPQKAYFDAVNEARRRDASYYLDYGYSRPSVISRGSAAKRWNSETQQATSSQPLEGSTAIDGKDGSAEKGEYSKKLEKALQSVTDGADELPTPASEQGTKGPASTKSSSKTSPAPSPKKRSTLPPLDLSTPSQAPPQVTPPPPKRAPNIEINAPRPLDPDLDLEAARPVRTAVSNPQDARRAPQQRAATTKAKSIDVRWKD